MDYIYVNMQAVFLGHQGADVHAVCLQNKLSQMTVEENGLSLLYGMSTTENRLFSLLLHCSINNLPCFTLLCINHFN